MRARLLTAALCLGLAGCGSTSAEGSFRDMAGEVERRIGQKPRFRTGGAEDAEIDRAIKALLGRELSADGAVQIALVNNRSLHVEYEELSIAQADLVQAGLLKNPAFSAGLLFHLGHPGPLNLNFGVEHDFLSLLFIPAKKRVAEAQLERAKHRVGGAVLELASEVRVAYFTLVGAQQVMGMQRTIGEAFEAAAELAKRQNEAGTLSDLDTASERAAYEQVKLDMAKSEAEITEGRERLNRLLGLWGARTTWSIRSKLPEIPAADPPLDHAESIAIRQRLDIAAARGDVQIAAHALSIAKSGRFLGGAELGAEIERDDGEWQAGPTAHVELPIFDQGQAGVARLEAELRQSEHRLAALAIDVRSEVREARARVVLARAVAEHYRKVLVPLREQIVALAQQHYDAMLLGVYQLLEAKRSEVETYRGFIEAVRDYWIAWTNLERAAGGRLSKSAPSMPQGSAQDAPNAPNKPITPAHEHGK